MNGVVCYMVPANSLDCFKKWLDEEIHKATDNMDESWDGETAAWFEARLDALTEVRNRLGFLNGSQG
jgi:hypothetical protein